MHDIISSLPSFLRNVLKPLHVLHFLNLHNDLINELDTACCFTLPWMSNLPFSLQFTLHDS